MRVVLFDSGNDRTRDTARQWSNVVSLRDVFLELEFTGCVG